MSPNTLFPILCPSRGWRDSNLRLIMEGGQTERERERAAQIRDKGANLATKYTKLGSSADQTISLRPYLLLISSPSTILAFASFSPLPTNTSMLFGLQKYFLANKGPEFLEKESKEFAIS